MTDLRKGLHDSVAPYPTPDTEALWSRGRRARRRRAGIMGAGGLVAVLAAAGALTQLADSESSIDTIGEPDQTLADDPVVDDEAPESDAQIPTIEVPDGALVPIYPVGLDGWTITIEPDRLGSATNVSLRNPETGVQAIVIWDDFEEGEDRPTDVVWGGESNWEGDMGFPDGVQHEQSWRGPNFHGSILTVSADSEGPQRLGESLVASAFYTDPEAEPPAGWLVNFDSRHSIGGSEILASSPSGAGLRLSTIVFTETSPRVENFADFGPHAPSESPIEVMGGWAYQIQDLLMWDHGESMHFILLDPNLPPSELSDFLAALRPVETTEVPYTAPYNPDDAPDNPDDAPAADVGPAVGDHWHAAYGIYECGEYWPIFEDVNDPDGIHTHGNGLIHIHPFGVAATGTNATFGKFLNAVGMTFEPGQIFAELSSRKWDEVECDGEPSETRLLRWSADDLEATPRVARGDDIFTAFFEGGREVWVLARVPIAMADADIPLLTDRLETLDIAIGLIPPPD